MPTVLVAKYRVTPGNSDSVQDALVRMAALVKADEPGCLLYQANRSTEEQDLFLLYEVYTDADALAAHRETPHFKAIVEGEIVPLLAKREREIYEQVSA